MPNRAKLMMPSPDGFHKLHASLIEPFKIYFPSCAFLSLPQAAQPRLIYLRVLTLNNFRSASSQFYNNFMTQEIKKNIWKDLKLAWVELMLCWSLGNCAYHYAAYHYAACHYATTTARWTVPSTPSFKPFVYSQCALETLRLRIA